LVIPSFDVDVIRRIDSSLLSILPRLVGCSSCEWRYGSRCPVKVTESGDTLFPVDNICPGRIEWVKGFLPPYSIVPSVDRLLLDLSKGLQGFRERKEFDDILVLEESLSVALESRDFVESERLEELLRRRKNQFRAFSELVSRLRDKQVDRDTPKSLDLSVRGKIPIEDINRILRGEKVVDVEVLRDD